MKMIAIIAEAVLAVIGWAGVLILQAQHRKVKAEVEMLRTILDDLDDGKYELVSRKERK